MHEDIKDTLKDIMDYWENDIRDEDVSELGSVIKDSINKRENFNLYRYMPPNYYSIRNFETQKIHLSPNGKMNDIFEGMPQVLGEIPYNRAEKLKDLVYMTCMSEEKSDLLMWSHYTQNHEGFCVEYDLKRLKDDPLNILEHIFPVLYTEHRSHKRNLESLIESHIYLKEAISNQECYDGCEDLDDIIPMFLIKSDKWKYENEWRIIYSSKQMYDIDKDELYQCNLSFKCISAVYLGFRIQPEIKENILEICKRNSAEGNVISVHQAKMSKKNFELAFEQLR